jgi:hypothetical protein
MLNPHLCPKKSDQSATEAARRKVFQEALQTEKRAFTSIRVRLANQAITLEER